MQIRCSDFDVMSTAATTYIVSELIENYINALLKLTCRQIDQFGLSFDQFSQGICNFACVLQITMKSGLT